MHDSRITEEYYESCNGLRLFYRSFYCQSGIEADPVICLPCLTRNSRDFDDLALLLSKRRRVITTDLRGRGHSEYDPDRTSYHPAQYVADIWDLLDHLDVSRVIVIGTSLGGWMAMLMADERPAAIAGAVMNDIGPELDPAGVARVQASAGLLPPVADWDEAVVQVKQHYELAYPDWPDSKWLSFAQRTYSQSGNGDLDINLDRNVGVASREGVSGLLQDPWQLFDTLLPIPLLVLRGEKSDLFSAATLEKMQLRKPDLTAVIIRNRGHAPYLDEPEAIDAIERFLEEN